MAKGHRHQMKKAPSKDADYPSTPCLAHQQAIALQPRIEEHAVTVSHSSSYSSSQALARKASSARAEARPSICHSTINTDDGPSPPSPFTLPISSHLTPPLLDVGPSYDYEQVYEPATIKRINSTSRTLYISATQSPGAIPIASSMGLRSVQSLVDLFEQQFLESQSYRPHGHLADSEISGPRVRNTHTQTGTMWLPRKRLDSAIPITYQDDIAPISSPEDQKWNEGDTTRSKYFQEDFIESIASPKSSPLDFTINQATDRLSNTSDPTTPPPPPPPPSAIQSWNTADLWAKQDLLGWGPPSHAIQDLLAREAAHEATTRRPLEWQPIRRLSRGITGGFKRTMSLGKGRKESGPIVQRMQKREQPVRTADERQGGGALMRWRGPGMLLGRAKTVVGVYGRRRFMISDETMGGEEGGEGEHLCE